jgi:hypothetical protein
LGDERLQRAGADVRYTRDDITIGGPADNLPGNPPFLPVALAYGTSPSGEPVPIRVDEDGYVLTRHVVGRDCAGEVAEDHVHTWKDGIVIHDLPTECCTTCGTYRKKP